FMACKCFDLRGFFESLRNFGKAERGNVAITFTLALIPIIGFVGAAVDYSRANADKAAMQAAVESTALTLSKEAQNLTSTQLSEPALAVFKALLHRPDVTGINVVPIYTAPSAGTFKL